MHTELGNTISTNRADIMIRFLSTHRYEPSAGNIYVALINGGCER